MPVDPRRTVSDLEQLRALTADEHGAQRIAWTPTWLKARAWFQAKLADFGLGRAYRDSGRLEDGAALIEQALASHRAQGNKLGEAEDLEHLGQAMAQSDRPAEARGLLTRAAELFEEIGEDTQAARIRNELTGPGALTASA